MVAAADTDRGRPTVRKEKRGRRIVRRSAHGRVTESLGLRIVGGDFPVGAVLPAIDDMMVSFKVSRTALREALQTLAAKGLIASKTRVGTRVLDEGSWNMFDADILAWRLETGFDRAFLARLLEMREAVEPAAAALAALRASPEQVERMRGLVAEMGRPEGHDRDSFTDTDLAFHNAILDAAGNPFMRSIGAVIEAALAVAFTISAPYDDEGRRAKSVDQHARIADAIGRGDPQGACDAMRTVIRQGGIVGGIDTTARGIAALNVTAFGI